MSRQEPHWQEQRNDEMVTWRPIEPAQPVEGPLALDFFSDRTLVLELAIDQLAFREQDGQLKQVYFDGLHRLRIGEGPDDVPPTGRLFFLRGDVPLTWRWRDQASLRVDTGSEPGALIPVRGLCSVMIDDPAAFHRQILLGLETLEPEHLTGTLDTLVRTQIANRLESLVERGHLDPMQAQILLGDLSAGDLNEDLQELGLRCIHLAVCTPSGQEEPAVEVALIGSPAGSYDDVF